MITSIAEYLTFTCSFRSHNFCFQENRSRLFKNFGGLLLMQTVKLGQRANYLCHCNSGRQSFFKTSFYFYFFFVEIRLGISCKLSAWQMIHMKCQALFSLKKVWSWPVSDISYSIDWFCIWATKALIWLCDCRLIWSFTYAITVIFPCSTTRRNERKIFSLHLSSNSGVRYFGFSCPVICASTWWSGGCRLDPQGSDNLLSLRLWNILYCHSPPSADSRRAVVSFWQKNVYEY